MKISRIVTNVFLCLFLVGCTWSWSPPATPQSRCDNVNSAPTRTKDLPLSPVTPAYVGTPTSIPPCAFSPTPVPTVTRSYRFDGYGTITNLTLDFEDNRLIDLSAGRNRNFISWISNGINYGILTNVNSSGEVQPISVGTSMTSAFSDDDRLHLVYDDGGHMYYLAVDEHESVFDESNVALAPGHPLSMIVDKKTSLAHLAYQSGGDIYVMSQKNNAGWADWDQSNPINFGAGDDAKLVAHPTRQAMYLIIQNGTTLRPRYIRLTSTGLGSGAPIPAASVSAGATLLSEVTYTTQGNDLWGTWVERTSATDVTETIVKPQYSVLASGGQRIQGTDKFSASIDQVVQFIDAVAVITATIHTTSPSDVQIGITPIIDADVDDTSIFWSPSMNGTGTQTTTFGIPVPSGGDGTIVVRTNSDSGQVNILDIESQGVTILNSDFSGGSYLWDSDPDVEVSLSWNPSWKASDGLYGETTNRDRIINQRWFELGVSWNEGVRFEMSQNSVSTDDVRGEIRGEAWLMYWDELDYPPVSTGVAFAYGEGDVPYWNPNAHLYGRLRARVCKQRLSPVFSVDATKCSQLPGDPFFDDIRVLDVERVYVARSTVDHRYLVVWEGWQPGMLDEGRDLYTTLIDTRDWWDNPQSTVP